MCRFSTIIAFLVFGVFFASCAAAEELKEPVIAEQSAARLAEPVLPQVRRIDYRLPVAGAPPPALAIMAEDDLPLVAPEEVAVGPQELARAADETQVVVEGRKYPDWEEIRPYELTYQALNLVDAVQTVVALRSNRLREMNPLLGSNPSTITVIGYKAAWGGAHYLITRWLMRDHPRYAKAFQFATIAVQGTAVTWNMTRLF